MGDAGLVATSTDSLHWRVHRRDPNFRNSLCGVAAGPDALIAAGRQAGAPSGGLLLRSTDAGIWNTVHASDTGLNRVAHGNGRWVAVGLRRHPLNGAFLGVFLHSQNGTTWSGPIDRPETTELTDVAFANGRFVMVGNGGAVFTSTDGVTWLQAPSGTSANLLATAGRDGRIVAAGDHGTLITSADGMSWQAANSGTSNRITALAAHAGWLVGVGDNGTVVVSRDGLQWEARTTGVASRLSGVGAGGGQFLAVGEQGMILASITQQPDEVGLALPSLPDDGPYSFTVFGPATATVTIQESSNLKTWTTLYQVPGDSLPARALGGWADAAPARFYRGIVLSR